MAVLMTPTNLQKMEFDVTTAEGPSRVTIVTGMIEPKLQATAPSTVVQQKESYKALLDPTLPAGAFRKATATASLSSLSFNSIGPGTNSVAWRIDDAQATFDDETGKTQLVVDLSVALSGSTFGSAQAVMFQVTTLSRVFAA
jgi:hypothetical protein